MKSIVYFSLLFSILFIGTIKAQGKPSDEAIIKAVNADVWTPFLESYRDLDIDKMLSIQDPEMTRVSIDRNVVRKAEDYFASLRQFFDNMKSTGSKMNIEFSILSTAISEGKVYQRGYYTVNIKQKGSDEFRSTGYSQFTVLLLKKNGKWKINLDADHRVKITKEEFEATGNVLKL
ncbi:MAG: hypothetical protein CMB99_04325 [Flavobacteriaceae bacterium]|nr:hypothetical protein [Flavobacteriaceae bacterium]|tara:strand:- start:75641 stop:76168 length:528 start_codon:yes stop_codon:yes gene_type:complete